MNAVAMSLENHPNSLPTRPETAFAVTAVMLGNRPVRELSTLVNWTNSKGFQAVKCQPWGYFEETDAAPSMVATDVKEVAAAAIVPAPATPTPELAPAVSKQVEPEVVPETASAPVSPSLPETKSVGSAEVKAEIVPEKAVDEPIVEATVAEQSPEPTPVAPVVAAPVVSAPVVAALVVAAPVVEPEVITPALLASATQEEVEIAAPSVPSNVQVAREVKPDPVERKVQTVANKEDSKLDKPKPGSPVVRQDAHARPTSKPVPEPVARPVPAADPVVSAKREQIHLPSIPETRRSTSNVGDDYVQQLEQLVIELNYELGRIGAPQESESGSPTEWLVDRMLKLNLQNMALKEQLRQTTRIHEAI